jgi:integrase
MAKLTKVKGAPGIYRAHRNDCEAEAGRRCECPPGYIVRWKHLGRSRKRRFRTIAEAREFKGKVDAGEKQAPSRETVRSYYGDWIKEYRGRTTRGLEDSSRRSYETSFERHVLPEIGTVRLRDLSAKRIREWMQTLERKGRSANTIRKARAALSAMLATAVEDDDLTINPAVGVRYVPSDAARQRHEKRKRRELHAEDVGAILAAMPERWRVFFALLTQTGVRIGELLGLTWGRVELGDDPCIYVVEQVYRGRRKRLKTEASLGRVPLSQTMARELQQLRPDGVAADAPVFPSKTGTPLNYHNVLSRVLHPALRECGIAIPVERDEKGKVTKWDYQGVAFHAFRKACGSLLFDSGKNPRQVQRWLRHSQLTTTMNVYIHDVDDGLGGADLWDEIDWTRPAGDTAGDTGDLKTDANPAGVRSPETAD